MPALGFGGDLALGQRGRGAVEARFDFTGGTMPAGATVTRASAGSHVDASGLLVSAPADAARFDHDPATGAVLGLLIEPERTNLLPSSADFTSGWINAELVTGAGATAPDGGASQRLTVPAGSYGPYCSIGVALAQGTRITLSAWRRSAAAQTPAMGTNGLINSANNRGVAAASGSDWQRFSFVLEAAADSGVYAMPFSLHWSNGGGAEPDRIGDLWGAQLEVGDGATSYIATDGAGATRAPDALVLDWARFGRGNGPVTLAVTYHDGSVQAVAATIAGGTAELSHAGSGLTQTRVRSVRIA